MININLDWHWYLSDTVWCKVWESQGGGNWQGVQSDRKNEIDALHKILPIHKQQWYFAEEKRRWKDHPCYKRFNILCSFCYIILSLDQCRNIKWEPPSLDDQVLSYPLWMINGLWYEVNIILKTLSFIFSSDCLNIMIALQLTSGTNSSSLMVKMCHMMYDALVSCVWHPYHLIHHRRHMYVIAMFRHASLELTSGASSPLMIRSCRRIQRSVPARTSCLRVIMMKKTMKMMRMLMMSH